ALLIFTHRCNCMVGGALTISLPLNQRTFQDNLSDSDERRFRHKSELFDLLRVHDCLNRAEENLDHEFGRDIPAYHSCPLAFNKKFSEILLNQLRTATLDYLEHMRRFQAHVAHKRRLD